MANRIKVVLSSIVGFSLTGFMKGRFIGENIRFTLDLIEYCKESAKPGLIFLVDFEKAFDRLEWSFVFKSLQKFKFGDCFIQWVKTLYRNGNSCVCNNGYSSGNFMLNRGVRQGCPLSPYLFILCVEVLAQKVLSNELIKGVSVMNNEIKLLQYADDTIIFLDGTESSFKEVLLVLEDFRLASGLNVNYDKCSIFPLGPSVNAKPRFMDDSPIIWTLGPVTLLGVSFSNNRDDLFTLNFPPKLSRLKKLLHLWSTRDLTPVGKNIIVKSFAISQLVFLFLVLPNPPTHFVKELNTLIFDFIWSGKPEKIGVQLQSTLINWEVSISST